MKRYRLLLQAARAMEPRHLLPPLAIAVATIAGTSRRGRSNGLIIGSMCLPTMGPSEIFNATGY